jgi:hypothetical protein
MPKLIVVYAAVNHHTIRNRAEMAKICQYKAKKLALTT